MNANDIRIGLVEASARLQNGTGPDRPEREDADDLDLTIRVFHDDLQGQTHVGLAWHHDDGRPGDIIHTTDDAKHAGRVTDNAYRAALDYIADEYGDSNPVYIDADLWRIVCAPREPQACWDVAEALAE